MILQMTNGYLEAVVLKDCDVDLFYRTADWMQTKMELNFQAKQKLEKVLPGGFSLKTLFWYYDMMCCMEFISVRQPLGWLQIVI